MNTNTNINTNTNDPNTNRAGEEFDQLRWMTIDQWPNLLGEKVTRERGKKMLTILMSEKVATKRVNIDIVQEMLTNLMSEKVTRKRVNINVVDQPHEWESDEEKSESNATDSRLQQLHAVMSNEVWLAHHNPIFLSS